jgi:predicted house-cleaning NTP pyrophosphatase (Maf/HAM1 superfamily)
LRVADTWTFDLASAVVEFSAFSDEVLGKLVHSKSWHGKAGAYDLAGAMAPYATLVEGEEATVLGIPAGVIEALSAL